MVCYDLCVHSLQVKSHFILSFSLLSVTYSHLGSHRLILSYVRLSRACYAKLNIICHFGHKVFWYHKYEQANSRLMVFGWYAMPDTVLSVVRGETLVVSVGKPN